MVFAKSDIVTMNVFWKTRTNHLKHFFFIADVCKFSDILADVYDSSSRVGHSRQATYKFLS
jgi:hypothetical protein